MDSLINHIESDRERAKNRIPNTQFRPSVSPFCIVLFKKLHCNSVKIWPEHFDSLLILKHWPYASHVELPPLLRIEVEYSGSSGIVDSPARDPSESCYMSNILSLLNTCHTTLYVPYPFYSQLQLLPCSRIT